MRKLKILLFFIASSLAFHGSVAAQDQKEKDFKRACSDLLKSVSKKQLAGLNSFVHPTYGVYVLFRTGAMDEYKNFKNLDGDRPFIFDEHPVTAADLKKYSMQYGKSPSYDCGDAVWKKRGYIADSSKIYKPVSDIVAFRLKYEKEKISKKDNEAIKFVEQNSRKIVFTGSKGDGVIFFMSYINGKWWLSVIDTVTTDCSA